MLAQFRRERVASVLKFLDQCGWNGGGKETVCGVGAIAATAEVADFVFDLDHEDGLLILILLADVLHESGEGVGVAFEGILTKGRKDFELGSVGGDSSWEALCVLLDPGRRVAGETVLPTAEPEDYEMEMLLVRDVDPVVEDAEVEGSLGGLDLLPGDGHEDCVDVQLGDAGEDGVCLGSSACG